jgi:toxin-antitoxin system PIN domain toxin
MRGLLDVNVLVALLDRQHVAHARAHLWLFQHLDDGWASCPLTENGCLRVLTNPRYPAPLPAADVLAKLKTAKSSGHHEFWPDDLSVTDSTIFEHSRFRGHQQVTDAYLLALASQHGGRLVTFDTGIPTDVVKRASQERLVIL